MEKKSLKFVFFKAVLIIAVGVFIVGTVLNIFKPSIISQLFNNE